jgi:carbon monoxide dehydrogenase subunit G
VQLEHSFIVPAGVDAAWNVLLDMQRIAPCLPGVTIDSVDDEDFVGSVKVKLGPINLTYSGRARFIEKDEIGHLVVIDARGRDARGNGTATATVTARLSVQAPGRTQVEIVTDLDVTGKPAQFGRGVMADVGNRLIEQFADCLAAQLGGASAELDHLPDQPAGNADLAAVSVTDDARATAADLPGVVAKTAAGATPTTGAQPISVPRPRAAEPEPIDLMAAAGPIIVKRLAPILGGALVVVFGLVLVIVRRRRAQLT